LDYVKLTFTYVSCQTIIFRTTLLKLSMIYRVVVTFIELFCLGYIFWFMKLYSSEYSILYFIFVCHGKGKPQLCHTLPAVLENHDLNSKDLLQHHNPEVQTSSAQKGDNDLH